MDQYFEWDEMTEGRKLKFAKLSLIRLARIYWDKMERLIIQRGQEPIATWKDLKAKLREEYLPMSYHQQLLNQWSKLVQGTKSVNEYITKFHEVVERCLVDEPETMTISRFQAGLREDIKYELFQWRIHYLEDAYQIARDFERNQKEILISLSKSNKSNTSGHGPSSSQIPSIPIIPVVCKEEIQKSIEEPEIEIYEADPNLVDEFMNEENEINKVKRKEPTTEESIEIEIYEADESLINEYEKEEEILEAEEILKEEIPEEEFPKEEVIMDPELADTIQTEEAPEE